MGKINMPWTDMLFSTYNNLDAEVVLGQSCKTQSNHSDYEEAEAVDKALCILRQVIPSTSSNLRRSLKLTIKSKENFVFIHPYYLFKLQLSQPGSTQGT